MRIRDQVLIEREPLGPWAAQANCVGVDAELFFPSRGGDIQSAKEVCRGCPVREACLEHALSNNERFGIWGGLSELERRKLLRHRRRAA